MAGRLPQGGAGLVSGEGGAREERVDVRSLGKGGEEGLGGYVGNRASIRTSLDLACNVVEAARRRP